MFQQRQHRLGACGKMRTSRSRGSEETEGKVRATAGGSAAGCGCMRGKKQREEAEATHHKMGSCEGASGAAATAKDRTVCSCPLHQ